MYGKPARIVSALDIMIEGPIGGAAFNNELEGQTCAVISVPWKARPQGINGVEIRGYHKPIMIAGGYGNIREEHVDKGTFDPGSKLVILGGPAMLIGLGGGAASSMASGQSAGGFGFRVGAATESGN